MSISISTSAPGAGGTPSSTRLSRAIPKSARFVVAVPWKAARAGLPGGISGNIPLKPKLIGTTLVMPRMVATIAVMSNSREAAALVGIGPGEFAAGNQPVTHAREESG